ncbi:MAG: BatD family protein, partial [Desulfobacteraceae bacterium]|nr:BatD family protein [Desulfobacteraceae bacterium]
EELTQNGYVKKKIFKKALVPVKPGDFTIPEIGLIYFDTQSGKYKKTTAAPIEIRVTKSADDKESSLQIPGNNIDEKKIIKHEVEFTGRDILPLKQGADVLKNQKDLSFNVFALLIFSPFIIFCLIKFFTGFTKKERSNSVVMKQKAVEALKNARDTKLSHEDFLNHIRKAVVSSILSKGDITGESLTKEEAYKILQKSSLNNKEIEDILNTLNDIESAKYGGESLETNKRKEFFSKAKQIIKICSIIFCIMSFVSFIPLKAQAAKVDESGTLFLEGVKEYKSGNFETAAQKFEIIALNGIKNGKLYYNTANAFLKAGDVGKAVLWYERAKKLIPSDADLKFNLDYAQERLKDINDSKSLNFSDILFFWKNYFSSNLIRYSAIILSFIVFLYSSIRVINRKKIFTTAGSLAFVLFLLVLSTALFDYYQLYNTNSAIIIPDKVSVRSGLSEDSTELFILHAGTKVKVDKENNEFFRISFSKGKLGWVKKGDAVKI